MAMKNFWQRPRLIIKSTVDLKDEEVQNQMRSLSPAQYAALKQIIFELERDAIDGATKAVANHGIAASCIGGAEHLRLLLDRLEDLRKRPETPQIQLFVERT
jgi:hypothetical protein